MDYSIAVEPVTDDRKSKPGETIVEARTFSPGVEQITFGRDPTNDIVFPPESQRIVSRKHGRFYREASGDYAIEPFGGRYVEVDGYPAVRGQPVKDGALIRVGDKDGPVIRVRLEEVEAGAGAPDVAVTGRRKEVEPLGKRLVRMRQVQIAALAAIVVVAAAVGWVLTRQPSLEAELAALRETASAAAAAEFASTEALRQAAYAVILRRRDGQESLQGTAWSYQPGLLVTNAHVAVLFESLRPGETLIVRPPAGNGVDHVVTGNHLHPGYHAFRTFLGEANALSAGFRAMTRDLPWPSAYDVGVLEVDNGAALAPGLPIAPGAGPDALRPGMALAFAGYPIEGSASQMSAQISPNPQLQFGAVTSLTNYLLFGSEPAEAYLVQNSLPAAGGASGSAIVDKDGFVVAVLSGGTVVATETGRTPSAVLLNYAQRADLIPAALDPALFDLAAARASWEAALARFDSHEVAMVEATRTALGDSVGGNVGEADIVVPGSLGGSSAVRAGATVYSTHDIAVVAGRTYALLAYGDLDGSLSIALFRDGKGLGGAGGGRWFAETVFTAEKDETLQLRILGPSSAPSDYKLYVFSADQAATAAASP